jgi:hypothetical protein
MSAFKEELFFSGEIHEAILDLKSVKPLISKTSTPQLAKHFDRKVYRIERLLFWFHRRQTVVRASAHKPFLFSELKAALLKEVKEQPSLFSSPRFKFKKDFYLSFRFSDMNDALLGVYRSLHLATSSDIKWDFDENEDSILISFRFKLGYDDFNLNAFCQKLVWQGTDKSSCDAGFPFLEAVMENGKGKFRWHYKDGYWELELTLPVLKAV